MKHEHLFTRRQRVAKITTYPIREAIDIQNRSDAAPLISRTVPKSPFSCVNRSPIRFGFRDGATAIRLPFDKALFFHG